MGNPTKDKVLITGIKGFTGVHLEASLKQRGYDVYGTTISVPVKKEHFKCDILNFEALLQIVSKIKPDYVIHLAAISFVASRDIAKIYEINVQGTVNLLDSLYESGTAVKKVIIVSSAAVYGKIGRVLSEEMCPKAANHYGNSKLAMENMTANYYDKLDIVVTRPFNYTGVGQEKHFLVPKIVSHFKEKRSVIELGNLNTFREYNNVNFVVQCYLKLMLGEFKSGVVNISSGKTFSINDILSVMSELSSHKIKIEINQKFIRRNEIRELKGSSEKLLGIIGSLPLKFSLKETLNQMYLSK